MPGCAQETFVFSPVALVGLSPGGRARKGIPGTGNGMRNGSVAGKPLRAMGKLPEQ